MVFIDISEEWFQLTGFPLVNGFWIANDLTSNKSEISMIIEGSKRCANESEKISKNIGLKPHNIAKEYLKSSISQSFGQQELNSLEEMYRYAFFYGFTEYVPDLVLYRVKLLSFLG